ncbi:hypothetical protein OG258_50090 [Streptomyces mirabilis]|uniref:hypothetical protein n=1 Tax=Streptomyces mirabilis TaxID=68239 RepID=UPI002E28F9A7|nr:hypothetical protein [Streptomyces mirabilis]
MSDQTVKRSCQAPHLSGLLSPDELRAAVHSGEITTVMLAVPDMMGRLKGKRLSASVFLDRMLSKAEACAYILATDVDMTPLEGFDLTGWDDGYGDLCSARSSTGSRPSGWRSASAWRASSCSTRAARPRHTRPDTGAFSPWPSTTSTTPSTIPRPHRA